MLRIYSMCRWTFAALLLAKAGGAAQAPPANTSAKHPFTAKDWSTLRSARVTAVSRDGMILYHVGFGGEKGPSHSEWWTISANGANPTKLELSEDFSAFGFSADGSSLYGKWKLNKLQQLAVFPLVDHKAASVPLNSSPVAARHPICRRISRWQTLCHCRRSPPL
jgi:hypothetical protein